MPVLSSVFNPSSQNILFISVLNNRDYRFAYLLSIRNSSNIRNVVIFKS